MKEHDPSCTECEHDCPHRRNLEPIFGDYWCQTCDDHWWANEENDAAGEELDAFSTTFGEEPVSWGELAEWSSDRALARQNAGR